MSERYGVISEQSAVATLDWDSGTAVRGQGEIQGAVTVRAQLYDLVLGHSGTAGDNVIRWELGRVITTLSTGTTVVPNNLDFDGPAALSAFDEDISAMVGEVAASQMLEIVLNQRATFRWVAAPGGEIRTPAVATSASLLLPSSAGYAGVSEASWHWTE